MTAVKAIYDGKVFIPEKPCKITKGSEVTLTIVPIYNALSEKQKKLAAFRQLTREISALSKTDPLPAQFDDIISERVQFRDLALS